MNNDEKLDEIKNRLTELEKKAVQYEQVFKLPLVILSLLLSTGAVAGAMGLFFNFTDRIARLEEKTDNISQSTQSIKEQIRDIQQQIQNLSSVEPPPDALRIVAKNGILTQGYGMGVNSSFGVTDWVTTRDNAQCMAYPGGPDENAWGAVFITVGEPSPIKRGLNFSNYKKLLLELKREQGNQSIYISLRDEKILDNNPGDRYPIEEISNAWKEYEIELSQDNFPNTDFSKLYTITSFIFTGKEPQTVCFKSIKYD